MLISAPAHSTLLINALQLLENTDRRHTSPGPLRSLVDFPGSDPLTIILGDRRESRAKSVADCLIYSGSATDAMYLNLLGSHMYNASPRSSATSSEARAALMAR